MKVKFLKRKVKTTIPIIYPKQQYFTPPKHPKPVKAYLTIVEPGIGSKIIPIKELSTEEILLPDGRKLYTGVSPDICHQKLGRKWKTIRMHYNLFGHPFTFEPRKWRIFSDEKHRQKLIEWGHLYYEFGKRKLVFVLDELHENFIERDTKKLVPLDQGKKYLTENSSKLESLEYLELPYVTEYDVTPLEMIISESFTLHASEAFEKMLKSMENLGKEKEPIWYMVMLLVLAVSLPLIFLYFANEGVFG